MRLKYHDAARAHGFTLRTTQQSWGGRRPDGGIVLFVHVPFPGNASTEWHKLGPGRYRTEVGWEKPGFGYTERLEHVKAIAKGTPGFALATHGKPGLDPDEEGFKVAHVDADVLWRIESVDRDDNGVWHGVMVHPGVAA